MERSSALDVRPRGGGGTFNRGRPKTWLASFMVALFAAALPAKAQPTFDSIVAQFDEVAFGHEHGNSLEVVRKWKTSPDLALFIRSGYDVHPHLKAIDRHLADIENLTGLRVRVASVPAAASLRVGFYPRAEFVNMPGDSSDPEYVKWITTSACIALAITDPKDKGRIAAGAIAIGTDIPPRQREHCILEELVQVLGLPNDACHYRPSLFCEDDRVLAMTPADRILLRTLYDPRLLAGMPKKEAMPTVRKVIAELMPQKLAQVR